MLLNKKNYLAIFLITIALIALAACGNGASENDKNNSNNETETEATQDDVEQVLNLSTTSCVASRSEEHTSELQSRGHLVCRLLLEKKNADKTDLRKIQ